MQNNANNKSFHAVIEEKTEITNPFPNLKDPIYKSSEIAFIRQKFEWITHPLVRPITALLAATIKFRTASDIGYFKKARDENLTKKELLDFINQIGHEFTNAKNTFNKNKTQYDEEAIQTLSDTINYCKRSVENRLAELKEIKDKMYDLYLHEDNELRKFLSHK